MKSGKKDPILVIGILIPVLMIVFIAGSIYVPRLFADPEYDFVYTNDSYYGEYEYFVENKQIQRRETNQTYTRNQINVYLYDVSEKESKTLTFEEARELQLDSSSRSPDGYEITRGGGSGGIFPLFFIGGDGGYFLKRGSASEKIHVTENRYYFKFMGWIVD